MKIIVARNRAQAEAFCREVGWPPHGRDVAIIGSPAAGRGMTVRAQDIVFVGDFWRRSDWREIIAALAPAVETVADAVAVPEGEEPQTRSSSGGGGPCRATT